MLILGSNSFYSIAVRQQISQKIHNKSGNMLIIPLACEFEEDTGNRERNCAVDAGFMKENIDVFSQNFPEDILNKKYDYIVVLGGNTFKLLHLVKKYHLNDFIRKQVIDGAIYFGFSAGAYLACPNIWNVRHFDGNYHINEEDVHNFDALGLTDKYVLCHYDSRGMAEIMLCREDITMEPELITINETELIIL